MIIFFFGENDFKIKEKLTELKNKFLRDIDQSGQNIFIFDGENFKINLLSENIGTGSLFSSKKMVIIKDLIKNKDKDIYKKTLGYLKENKVETSEDIIVFTESNVKKNKDSLIKINNKKESSLNKDEKSLFLFLEKQKFSQEFKKYSDNELVSLIKKHFSDYQIEIDYKEASLISSINNNNPWSIDIEVKKIAHFKMSNNKSRKVTIKDVEENSPDFFSENIFKLTDLISYRKKNEALKILEEQYLAGSEPAYILSMIIRQFKIMLQIRELLDLNYNSQKINKSLKLHPFIINKGINQAKNFHQSDIKKILNKLSEIDDHNKRSKSNLKVAINLTISKI
jgi:DNA polymerase III subunit delta